MGKQRDDQGDKVGRGTQPVKDGPVRCSKGLATRRADEASVLARMDANIALARLASGRTRQIGAECRCGVHACSPESRWGTYPKEYRWTPVFIANEPHHGLVGSYRLFEYFQ